MVITERYRFNINRKDEAIYVAAYEDGKIEALEFFKLEEGHLAFGWTDIRLAEYLGSKLDERKLKTS